LDASLRVGVARSIAKRAWPRKRSQGSGFSPETRRQSLREAADGVPRASDLLDRNDAGRGL
jgi:hypothetical protein